MRGSEGDTGTRGREDAETTRRQVDSRVPASRGHRVITSWRFPFALLLLALALSGIEGCVPSPTATPPRATPFPTLALPTDTPPPTATPTLPPTALTLQPTALPSPSATPTLTRIPPSPTPSPTATPVRESMLPLVQVFASPSTGPISVNQPVALSLFAADDLGLARLELYDEKNLYDSTPTLDPAPRTMSTVMIWKSEKLGMHHLRVVAYDLAGNVSAPVELALQVLNDNQPPTATITNPLGSIDLQVGTPLLLQGVATDEVAITRVDLFVDYQLYTYITLDQPHGQSPSAFTFMWLPPSAGVHTLFLRAHDNGDQTGNSAPLLVNAVDKQAPALTASYERDQVEANGTLLVHALALSSNNIARIELWADNETAQVVNSAAPEEQTTLDVQLVWQAGAVGDHTLFVRAYDRAGLNTSTAPQIIHVGSTLTRAPTVTPTAVTATATLPPAPSPTPTPQVVLPEPPTITLTTVEDRLALQLPGPAHIRLEAHGSVELDHVELWAFYQGESNPQFLFTDSAKGATDKTFDYAWTPPRAGVAFLFARVVDLLGQIGKSPVLPVYLIAPPAPTPTPAFFNLAPRWTAAIPTNRFTAEFVQLGSALRGAFTNTPLTGPPLVGSIIAGVVSRERVEFSVDFETPDALPHTLDFDCLPSAAPAQLACNYRDEAGNNGSAVFTPAP